MKSELPPIPANSVWFYTDEALSEGIAKELRREIAPQHPLFCISQRLVVFAKCDANDDILALDPEDEGQMFCLHLTWAGKHDPIPTEFPSFVKISNGNLTQVFTITKF